MIRREILVDAKTMTHFCVPDLVSLLKIAFVRQSNTPLPNNLASWTVGTPIWYFSACSMGDLRAPVLNSKCTSQVLPYLSFYLQSDLKVGFGLQYNVYCEQGFSLFHRSQAGRLIGSSPFYGTANLPFTTPHLLFCLRAGSVRVRVGLASKGICWGLQSTPTTFPFPIISLSLESECPVDIAGILTPVGENCDGWRGGFSILWPGNMRTFQKPKVAAVKSQTKLLLTFLQKDICESVDCSPQIFIPLSLDTC